MKAQAPRSALAMGALLVVATCLLVALATDAVRLIRALLG